MDGKTKPVTITVIPNGSQQTGSKARRKRNRKNKQSKSRFQAATAATLEKGFIQAVGALSVAKNNRGTIKTRKQVTGVANRSAASAEVKALVRAIALPHESAPQRFGGAENSDLTAVSKLPTVYPIKWDPTVNSLTTPNDLPPSDTQMFLFRDPLRSAIYYDQNLGRRDFLYQGQVNNGNDMAIGGAGVEASYNEIPLPPLNGASSYQPHGPIMYPGKDTAGRTYYWIDQDVVHMLGTGTPNQNIIVKATDEKTGTSYEANIVSDAISGDFDLPLDFFTAPTGYYRFEISSSSDAVLILQGVDIYSQLSEHASINPGVWCHRSAPGVDGSLSALGASRINSASMLLTNAAAEISKSGLVVGRQIPEGHDWIDIVGFNGVSNYTTVAQGSNFTQLQLATGMNMFLMPSGSDDFVMHNYVEAENSVVYSAAFDLDRKHPFLCFLGQTETAGAGNCFLTVTHHLEFTTDSPMFDAERPRISQAMRDAANMILQDVPQCTENPTHISDIWRAIKRGASSAMSGVGSFLKAVPGIAARGVQVAETALPLVTMLAAMLA